MMGDQHCTEIIPIEGLGYLLRPLHSPYAPFDAFCFPMEPEDFEAVAAEERAQMSDWIGVIYSLRDSDGRFVLVEVVSASYDGLYAMPFADRFVGVEELELLQPLFKIFLMLLELLLLVAQTVGLFVEHAAESRHAKDAKNNQPHTDYFAYSPACVASQASSSSRAVCHGGK